MSSSGGGDEEVNGFASAVELSVKTIDFPELVIEIMVLVTNALSSSSSTATPCLLLTGGGGLSNCGFSSTFGRNRFGPTFTNVLVEDDGLERILDMDFRTADTFVFLYH